MEGTVEIDGSMSVDVRQDGEMVDSWRFSAEPDSAPHRPLHRGTRQRPA